jgi:heme-degrading monooxygenase HmoA
MILEVAILDVRAGLENPFEAAFSEAKAIIVNTPGFAGLELQRCVERPNRYVLLVRWRSLEDHTVGFRRRRSGQKRTERAPPNWSHRSRTPASVKRGRYKPLRARTTVYRAVRPKPTRRCADTK